MAIDYSTCNEESSKRETTIRKNICTIQYKSFNVTTSVYGDIYVFFANTIIWKFHSVPHDWLNCHEGEKSYPYFDGSE